ncbi:MAG: methionine--tRNA ligase subunit beta, partial [Oscillospiraceae bacterium]|nr:methionine--tRNA ligase subunit beta [Oscillospiraceae bacterium]
ALRFVTTLLQAYLPNTTPRIAAQLGYTSEDLTYESLAKFGHLGEVKVQKGEVIFPRIDAAKELAAIAKEEAEKKAAREAAKAKEEAKAEEPAEEEKIAEITYDDFAKVNLIVGEIRDCQPVPKADKLLNNTVWDGKRERTILSGIHEWYEPADLIGRRVIIVDNLAPRKMRGFISEGMLLAADNPDGSAKVIFVDDIEPGSKVR